MSEDLRSLNDTDVEQLVRLIESLGDSPFDFLQLRVGSLEVAIGKGDPPGADHSPRPAAPAGAVTAEATATSHVGEPGPAVPAGGGTEVVGAPAATAPAGVADGQPARAPHPAAPADITSPIMGIFYAQPEPGAAPFVTVGSAVDTDTTVALVEVMKTFHAVPAGTDGTIAEVCVSDGQLVEYGQVLFRVEPGGG